MILWGQQEPLPSLAEHLKALRALPCVVTGQRPVTLHHCRGGSMAASPFGTPGVGQKQNDALQIPLHHDWHVGEFGIDCRINGGVDSWEERWGSQVMMLNKISSELGYSVWRLAYREAPWTVRARVERFLRDSPFLFLPVLTFTGVTRPSDPDTEGLPQ